MKTGDLVKHMPGSTTNEIVRTLHEDWGHTPDFSAALVVKVKESFALVLPTKSNSRPAWYQQDELEVISEAR